MTSVLPSTPVPPIDSVTHVGSPEKSSFILLDTHKLNYSELHYEVVDKLLRALLGQNSAVDVALYINIEESRVSAYRHSRAVLVLDGGEVAEIQRLNGFLRGCCGFGDVHSVNFGKQF